MSFEWGESFFVIPSEDGLFEEACRYAEKMTGRRKRRSGGTVYAHALRVAEIVRREVGAVDSALLSTAVLHDVMEDGGATEADVRGRFGTEMTKRVLLLTKPQVLEKSERRSAHHTQLLRGCWRVQVVKVADFIDNIRSRRSSVKLASTLAGAQAFLGMLEGEPLAAEVERAVTLLREEIQITWCDRVG